MGYEDRLSSRYGQRTGALTRGLGWFSIGLGLAEFLAPRALAGALGMKGASGVVRAYGAREIAAGVGILMSRDPAPWMWGRVAGDALDVGTLALGLDERNPRKGNVGVALAAVAGVALLDIGCAQALSARNARLARERHDFSDRSGLPMPPHAIRGAARDFVIPRDMRIPDALRPYTSARRPENAPSEP